MTAKAEQIPATGPIRKVDMESLLNAIYTAEGGPKAKVPYGVLSVPVADEAEARSVARRTVLHALQDWQMAGSKGSWLDAMADRYCPAQTDPQGHRNWKKNVRILYNRRVKP